MPPEDDPREESEEAYYADHPDNPANRQALASLLKTVMEDKRMACPSCGHTMQGVGNRVFHCPRCGTMRVTEGVADITTTDYIPTLVLRCRGFQKNMLEDSVPHRFADVWHRVGIGESINKPEDRPK